MSVLLMVTGLTFFVLGDAVVVYALAKLSIHATYYPFRDISSKYLPKSGAVSIPNT
jgi:hypothetical protein